MSKSKYVVGLAHTGYIESVVAVIFPEDVTHRDMAVSFFGDTDKILGAGFFHIGQNEHGELTAKVYGQSASLRTDSRPDDVLYLNQALGLDVDEDVLRGQQRKDEEAVRDRFASTEVIHG
jgi:hypothetical protein